MALIIWRNRLMSPAGFGGKGITLGYSFCFYGRGQKIKAFLLSPQLYVLNEEL